MTSDKTDNLVITEYGTHDFKDGVEIGDFEIEIWVQNVLRQIKDKGTKEAFGLVRSGDTVVFGTRYGTDLTVYIAKGYKVIHHNVTEEEKK